MSKFTVEIKRTEAVEIEIEAESLAAAEAEAERRYNDTDGGICDGGELGHDIRARYSDPDEEPAKEVTIIAWADTNGDGWQYNVYNRDIRGEDEDATLDGDDGGLCTGSLRDALEMAAEQADRIA